MRALLAILGIIITAQSLAATSTRVGGTLVYGTLTAVSEEDIVEVLDAAKSLGSGGLIAVEVVGPFEMRVHLNPEDLGWVAMYRVNVVEPTGIKHLGWTPSGRSIFEITDAMRVINTADDVRVFPLPTPLEPHRDDRHSRPLEIAARKELASLLGNENNWAHAHYDLVRFGDEPRSIGLSFRHGKDELLLFLRSGSVFKGNFNGENTGGFLLQGAALDTWEHRYAQLELVAK